jgi:hypothetical protein
LLRTFLLVLLGTTFALTTTAANLDSESLKKTPGFVWKSDNSNCFVYYFEPQTPAERDIEKIKAVMEESRASLKKLIGGSSQQKIDVFIVDSRKRMKELTGFEMNAWTIGIVQGVVYNDRIRAIGAHETCHFLAAQLWGKPSGLWANEGLAVYSDNNWQGIPLHLVAKRLLDAGQLLPLKTLTHNKFPKNADMITYPQSGSFVKFIYEKYGMNVMKDLWCNGIKSSGKPIEKTLPELEKEWLEELAKFDASAISYRVQ